MTEVKRISFSELKNWVECPHRHKLIHIDKIPHFSGNEYTSFGTAIHYVCENIVTKDVPNKVKLFETKFLEELSLVEETNEKLIDDLLEQGKNMVEHILPALKDVFVDYEVVSVEEQILEDIDEIDSYGRKFKGFIDLILKTPDGKYHVIDWKTCSWGWDSKKKTSPMTTYQLAYYKQYYSKKHNIDPLKIETHFALLKRTAKKNNVEIFRVTSGKKKIHNSLKMLEKAVINIERKNYIKNRLSCKYCKFHKTQHCT
jgi:ATP-dependent exoDNAse (exonuclease V) beta subunit|tara:strand:- start:3074 stop:3844 length:771 start_codon:yes stop_codon:yes gene_type:complete